MSREGERLGMGGPKVGEEGEIGEVEKVGDWGGEGSWVVGKVKVVVEGEAGGKCARREEGRSSEIGGLQ